MTKEFIHYEESDFFAGGKKEQRQESKRASRRDRSQYKKTDQDKIKKVEAPLHCRKGIVVRIRSQDVDVDIDGKIESYTLRGILKKDKLRIKNLVIVGDIVSIDGQGAIAGIDPRKKLLSRADNLSQQKEHLIAANVDQVLITVAVVDPPLRPSIIDRYLIAADKGGLTPIIVCNKIDLLDDLAYPSEERERERQFLTECEEIYSKIGVPFISISATSGDGMIRLQEVMKDRISVFSGQSGTGKSSLINVLSGLDLRVGKTVQSSKKGAHTTSRAELIKLPFGGYVVDTPGIKSFGVWSLTSDELRHYFPEIVEAAKSCKFQDCTHRGEDGCEIHKAIENKEVSALRYESYLNILSSLESKHLRR